MQKRNKRAIAIDNLVWWIIGIAVLAIMVVVAIVLKDKLAEIGEYIKTAFR
jgi:hypothetical protein